MGIVRRGSGLRIAIPGIVALTAVLLGGPAAPTLGAGRDCVVKNLTRPGTFSDLQAAHDAALAGDRLEVRGACLGTTTVTKDLTVTGRKTATSGVPTLDGGGIARVIQNGYVTLRLTGLTVSHGSVSGAWPDGAGGAILSKGTLILTDVLVRDNQASMGGAIAGTGTFVLAGNTRVRNNTASDGGGLFLLGSDARLTMKGTSSVHRHQGATNGGGIVLRDGARATITGSATIHHNAAVHGAAVFVRDSRLVVSGDARIYANTASRGTLAAYAYVEPAAIVLKGRAVVSGNTIDLALGETIIVGAVNDNGIAATLTLGESASIRNNVDALAGTSVVLLLTNGGPTSATMRGSSTVTGNRNGPGGATWILETGCGGTPTVSGVKTRTTGNKPTTPKIRTVGAATYC